MLYTLICFNCIDRINSIWCFFRNQINAFPLFLACGPGLYGDDCALPCPVNCLGKVCDVTDGTCGNCSDGWTGSYCDLCKYRGHDLFSCIFRNCSYDIPFQGHCSTLIKYVHFLACPTGTYGRDCASVCKGYCKGGCNHVTGKCDSGCEPGWDIENCNVGMSKSCIKFSSHFKFTCFVRIIISHYKMKGS